jgi:septal ring factor EnvC (AmiA/AmiB activator)
MLLGFVVAAPDLPTLHSQSRPDGAQKNSKRQAAPATDSSQQVQTEIILPDIYISATADSVAVLKRRLKHAENDLEKLQAERNRILKTLEELEKRNRTRSSFPMPRPMGPIVRPSV